MRKHKAKESFPLHADEHKRQTILIYCAEAMNSFQFFFSCKLFLPQICRGALQRSLCQILRYFQIEFFSHFAI